MRAQSKPSVQQPKSVSGKFGAAGHSKWAAAVLLTETRKEVPAGTEVDEIEHVDVTGAPLQVRETVPVNSLIAETCKYNSAV